MRRGFALAARRRFHSARVVFVLKVLHAFDRVLFCAGEERCRFSKFGTCGEGSPGDVLKVGLRNVAETKLLPDLRGGVR